MRTVAGRSHGLVVSKRSGRCRACMPLSHSQLVHRCAAAARATRAPHVRRGHPAPPGVSGHSPRFRRSLLITRRPLTWYTPAMLRGGHITPQTSHVVADDRHQAHLLRSWQGIVDGAETPVRARIHKGLPVETLLRIRQ